MEDVLLIHEQIVEWYLIRIRRGEFNAGDRIMSEKKCAERFSVSRNTVRRAYQTLLENKYITSIKGSGTYISNNIADLIPGIKTRVFSNYKMGVILLDAGYFADTVKGMHSEIFKIGGTLNIKYVNDFAEERKALSELIGWGANILITTPLRTSKLRSSSNYRFLQSCGIPYVMIGKPPYDVYCNAVYCDDLASSAYAVRLLKESGCTEVLHIADHNLDLIAMQERAQGFFLGMKEHYGNTKSRMLMVSNRDFEESLEKKLMICNGKMGIFLHDDAFSKKVLSVAKRFGLKLGKDIAVIGYNKGYSSHMNFDFGLASFEIPKFKMGSESIELARDILEERSGADVGIKHIILQPKYIRGITI